MGPFRPSSALRASIHLPLRDESLIYLGLSLADLWLTYTMLFQQQSRTIEFFEWNPVANLVLHGAGFAGMAIFKLTLIALVLVICQIIVRHKPAVARRVLNFGLLIVGGIVVYSLALLARFA